MPVFDAMFTHFQQKEDKTLTDSFFYSHLRESLDILQEFKEWRLLSGHTIMRFDTCVLTLTFLLLHSGSRITVHAIAV